MEKIVEGFTDLAFLIIKQKNLAMLEDDADAFNLLCEKKIISRELAKRLKQAKGMRNVIAHQYGNIDDEVVFEAISRHLANDTSNFLKKIRQIL